MEKTETAEAEAERTVSGGGPVEVVYRRDGRRETVLMRDLSYRQLQQWASMVRDDRQNELIELTCGRPAGWTDELTDESNAELAAASYRANFPRALKLSAKDPALGVKLAGMLGGCAEVLRLSDSFAGLSAKSLEPVSSESPAETGSASST